MKARFALLAMVVAAAPLAAQGGGGMGGMGGMGGGRMARGVMNVDTMAVVLGLDEASKAKYQAVVDDYNKNNMAMMQYMRGVRTDGGEVAPDSMTKMQAMRTKVNTDLRAMLNADQQKKFDSVVAATPQRGGGRRGGGGGGGGGGK